MTDLPAFHAVCLHGCYHTIDPTDPTGHQCPDQHDNKEN